MGISLEEHRRNEEITAEANIMPIRDVMRKKRLEWYGHVCRRESDEDIRRVYEMRVEGSRGHGRPKQRWSDTINADLRWLDLERGDTSDRIRWRSMRFLTDFSSKLICHYLQKKDQINYHNFY